MRALSRRYADATLLVAGSASTAAGLLGLAVADGWPELALASGAIAVGGALVTPALAAALSHQGESAQGEAQGLNQSAQSLGRVAGPLLFTSLYEFAGTVTPYLAACAVCTAALALAARGRRPALRQERA
jgi:MFS family permease